MLQTTLFTHLQIDGVAPDVGLVRGARGGLRGRRRHRRASSGSSWASRSTCSSPRRSGSRRCRSRSPATRWGCSRPAWCAPRRGWPRSSAASAGSSAAWCSSPPGAVVGQSGFLSFDSLRIVIIAAIYDAVIAPIVFPLVRRAARRDDAPSTWRMRGDRSQRGRRRRDWVARGETGAARDDGGRTAGRRLVVDRRARRRPLRAACSPGSGSCRSTGGEKLAVAAQRQRDRFVNVPALRGTIFDAKGNVLAQTMPVTLAHRRPPAAVDRPSARRSSTNLALAPRHRRPPTVDKLIDNQQLRRVRAGAGGEEHRSADQRVYVTEHRDRLPRGRGDAAPPSARTRNDFQAADMLGYIGQINADELAGAHGRRLPARRHHRQERRRADVRVRAARHAGRGQGRGRQPGPRGQRGRGEASRRPATTCGSPSTSTSQQIAEESLQQGMDGARVAGRPRQRQLLRGRTPARSWCSTRAPARWWRWRRTRPSTPTTSSPGNADQYFKDPTTRRCINRALNAVRAGLDVQAVHVDGDAAERRCSPRRRPRRTTTTRRLLPRSATTSRRCNAGRRGARLRRPAVRAHGVERRVLLHVGQRVLERLPRRGPGRGHAGDLAGDEHPRRPAPGRQRDPAHRRAPTASASRPASGWATRPA